MNKNIIDISWPISNDMTTYKDKKLINIEPISFFDKHGARDSNLHLNAHTGTHVDAPCHFVKDGETSEKVMLSTLVGACTVLDLTHVQEKITAQDLASMSITQGSRVLLKTRNSSLPVTGPFEKNFVYLEQSGAQYLADHNISAVGIDYLGVERNQPDHETHTILLGKNIPIIEGLRLGHVTAGNYQLYCLPLLIMGNDAMPARAMLMQD